MPEAIDDSALQRETLVPLQATEDERMARPAEDVELARRTLLVEGVEWMMRNKLLCQCTSTSPKTQYKLVLYLLK